MSNAHSPWCVAITHGIFATDVTPLWDLVAKFNGLPDLVPELIESGTTLGQGIGMRRVLQIRGGGSVIEELISVDLEHFRFSYAMRDLSLIHI